MTKDEFNETKEYYKKGIADIKKALKTTEENYATEVVKIQARVTYVSKELTEKIAELKAVKKEIEDEKEASNDVVEQNKALCRENEQLDRTLDLKEENHKEKVKRFEGEKETHAQKERDFIKKLGESKEEHERRKADAEYAEEKNRKVLKEIQGEKEAAKEIAERFEGERADFSEKRYKLTQDTKNHNDEIQKNNLLSAELDSKEKVLNEKEKANTEHADLLKKQWDEYNEADQIQKDKDIVQDLRDTELDKKERRIENLIEVNKNEQTIHEDK